MVFRTNFCLFWYFCNAIYYVIVLQIMIAMTKNTTIINSGDVTYFEFFAMYLAALVLFKVFFALLYLIMWRCRYTCMGSYAVQTHNLDDEFKRVKRTAVNGDSTDEEEMD